MTEPKQPKMRDETGVDRSEVAAAVLDAWGTAIRMDWSEIDGRQCQHELSEVSAYLRGFRETLTPLDVGVCVHGDFSAQWVNFRCRECYPPVSGAGFDQGEP